MEKTGMISTSIELFQDSPDHQVKRGIAIESISMYKSNFLTIILHLLNNKFLRKRIKMSI